MSGRGPQTFQKRQKEQQRKERQQEKMAKRLQRKAEAHTRTEPSENSGGDAPEIQTGLEREAGS
ncbi:MAG: hypothetical protein JO061_19060 [Acidobacteriaceae bacterium]|nr:hypothetical protein [Acidobacteriaceae bacterium]